MTHLSKGWIFVPELGRTMLVVQCTKCNFHMMLVPDEDTVSRLGREAGEEYCEKIVARVFEANAALHVHGRDQ